MQVSGEFIRFKSLTKRTLQTMTHHKVQAMSREKLIREIESKKRCSVCMTTTKRNRYERVKTYVLSTTTDFGKHIAAMALDSLGCFPYQNETARSNRFRSKDSAEFTICKKCYDTFYVAFNDVVFEETTCKLY